MQDPSTGSATCNGRPIYADCDPVDVDSLNSLHMEMGTAIKKLLDEDPLPFDCANLASYDQLCRAILKAIADSGCEADPASAAQLTTICDNLETHFVVTWLADGTPVRIPLSKFGEMDPGGGNGCPADSDGIVREVDDTYDQFNGDYVGSPSPPASPKGPASGQPSAGQVQNYSQLAPANQGWAGTWTPASPVTVQSNGGTENANLVCTTWTKTAC